MLSFISLLFLGKTRAHHRYADAACTRCIHHDQPNLDEICRFDQRARHLIETHVSILSHYTFDPRAGGFRGLGNASTDHASIAPPPHLTHNKPGEATNTLDAGDAPTGSLHNARLLETDSQERNKCSTNRDHLENETGHKPIDELLGDVGVP